MNKAFLNIKRLPLAVKVIGLIQVAIIFFFLIDSSTTGRASTFLQTARIRGRVLAVTPDKRTPIPGAPIPGAVVTLSGDLLQDST
ncbi:MAG: hypothetical protein ACRD4L_03285, partial [Pyrinomonadaceae bacterium]